jgi:hypothetical protein
MNRSRGDRRRESRENAASRTGSAPPAADVVAAAESHRRVVEAVMSLGEPYRTTILLRFFEDLPPRDVAARMGVPVETVRARVRRAVEKLRARLDDEHEGNRAAWLAPLFAAGRGRSSPSPIGAATTGVLAMTTTQKVALAIAAVLLLGVGVSIVGRMSSRSDDVVVPENVQRDTSDAALRRPRARTHDAPPDGAAAADAARATTPAAPEPSVPARDFVVRVFDPNHAPVPRIRVYVNVTGGQQHAITDDEGSVTLRVTSDVQNASADHEAADGHAWRQRGYGRRVAPGASSVELVVERWEAIRGRVVGEDRRPVRDAEVFGIVAGRKVAEALTDDVGGFTFAVPPDAACDVAATGRIRFDPARGSAGELVAEAWSVKPGGGEVVLVARVAASHAAVRVRAVTSDGRPLGGVSIDVTTPSTWIPFGSALTDAEGRASFQEVADRLVRVSVDTPFGVTPSWERAGWIAPAWESFVRPGGDELTLVFAGGRPIRGRVEFPADYPHDEMPGHVAPRAYVNLTDEDGITLSRTWSDDDLRFSVLAPASAKGPFRLSCGVRETSGRAFEAEATGVVPDAQDVVLKVAATKR